MKNKKRRVHHAFNINVRGLSAYGKAKAILEALEPFKMLFDYGYDDNGVDNVRIWWHTEEEM